MRLPPASGGHLEIASRIYVAAQRETPADKRRASCNRLANLRSSTALDSRRQAAGTLFFVMPIRPTDRLSWLFLISPLARFHVSSRPTLHVAPWIIDTVAGIIDPTASMVRFQSCPGSLRESSHPRN